MELRGDHWVRLASTSSEPNGPYSIPPLRAHRPPHFPPLSSFSAMAIRKKCLATPYRPLHLHQIRLLDHRLLDAQNLISELDLPATLKLNQARGANFAMPSRPGEVMMRP